MKRFVKSSLYTLFSFKGEIGRAKFTICYLAILSLTIAVVILSVTFYMSGIYSFDDEELNFSYYDLLPAIIASIIGLWSYVAISYKRLLNIGYSTSNAVGFIATASFLLPLTFEFIEISEGLTDLMLLLFVLYLALCPGKRYS